MVFVKPCKRLLFCGEILFIFNDACLVVTLDWFALRFVLGETLLLCYCSRFVDHGLLIHLYVRLLFFSDFELNEGVDG